MALHYYHSLGMFNVDENGNFKPDFSKIKNIAVTKATEKFKGMFEDKTSGMYKSGQANVQKPEEHVNDEYDEAWSRL